MDLNSVDKYKYTLISKKNFTRYALPYEIIPVFLCDKVNGHLLFDSEILKSLISQNLINDDYIVIKNSCENNSQYISFSDMKGIYFLSQDSLDLFYERSYENYDISLINAGVINVSKPESNIDITIDVAKKIDRNEFVDEMALKDAVLRIIFKKIQNNSHDAYSKIIKEKESLSEILKLIFSNSNSIETEMRVIFFKICSKYNVVFGWNALDLIKDFQKRVSEEIRESNEFLKWIEVVTKIINGENVNLLFDDSGNITLRAMTLVLLNPQLDHLENLKRNSSLSIGDEVYQLSCDFVEARFGYSFLNYKQRDLTNVKDFNFANIISYIYRLPDSIGHVENNNEIYKFELSNYSFLSIMSEEDHKIECAISGIKPISGFNLNLIYLGLDKKIYLRIIDRDGPKGMTKFKGKFIQDIVELQKDLPNGSRFEVNDAGLMLLLPSGWFESQNLKASLSHLFQVLKPLGVEQKSSLIIS
ncbi:hypothetical protein F7P73_17650 [Acinetobacter bohemicus]|uniref:Uncharacterized protein n=1 Tax=Acinetobacter bohemicus TaxID=1435036 RepID=A0A1I6WFR6_9GAMM|nr:hypothetical protein [Acinetobacter bohemicus]KAB0649943.1 hypothetical protein F7P73_17650 [Acinetobacter bohemicus]SFT24820.1 hypothetical protein SAMN05444586_10614 [Acinetobacter bohemicus]